MTTTARRALRCTALLALVAVVVLAAPDAEAKRLFTLDDPRGDDHGNGNLTYPLDSNFTDGDLDLLRLRAVREKGGTRFEATFANPIRQPDRGAMDELGTPMSQVARFGFYTFNIDIYIDKDRQPGSGTLRMLPGRKAEVDPEFAWERAVVLTPRPNVARAQIKDLMMKSLRQELRSDDPAFDDAEFERMKGMVPGEVESRIFFPTRVRVNSRTVSFLVPDEFLGGPADPEWGYVVVVTGADLALSFDLGAAYGLNEEVRERMMVLPIGAGKRTDRFGGAREDDPLQPPVIDAIVPEGAEQELLLNDYDPQGGRPVTLPGVVPAQR